MNVPLVSLIFLTRSLVFPILLFSSISLHWSLRKAIISLLAILCNTALKWVYLSFSPLPLASLLFTAVRKASSDNHFAFLHFFSWRWSWPLPPVQCHWTSIYSSSNILSIRSNPLNVFLTLAHSEKKSENKEHMLMQVSPKTQFLLWPLEGFKDQNIGKLRN